MCEHRAFNAEVQVNRLDDGRHFHADIQIWCEACGKQFQFIGLPLGVKYDGPTMSADAKEARLAIKVCDDLPNRRTLGLLVKSIEHQS